MLRLRRSPGRSGRSERTGPAAGRAHREAGRGAPDGKGRHAYIEPLSLLGHDAVFAGVPLERGARVGRRARSARGLGLFVGLSLLIALPLFYVLGGRSVGALYRSALQRARRDGLTDLGQPPRVPGRARARAVGAVTRTATARQLALLDIDDFKFENDRHGHPHGDALLCELAAVLRDVRAGDAAYRIGGDEFALVLRRTDAEGARAVARLRAAALRDAGVAASVGFSALRPDHERETLSPRPTPRSRGQAPRRQDDRRTSRDPRPRRGHAARRGPRAAHADRRGRRGDVAFQPIWDLRGGTRVLGIRGAGPPRRGVRALGPRRGVRGSASSVGRGPRGRRGLRAGGWGARATAARSAAFLNVSPQTLDHDGLAGDASCSPCAAAGFEPGRS